MSARLTPERLAEIEGSWPSTSIVIRTFVPEIRAAWAERDALKADLQSAMDERDDAIVSVATLP